MRLHSLQLYFLLSMPRHVALQLNSIERELKNVAYAVRANTTQTLTAMKKISDLIKTQTSL